jgi:hypothetical protein
VKPLAAVVAGVAIAWACVPGGRMPPAVPRAAMLRFQVLGDAGLSDTGPPRVSSAEHVITIRGRGLQLVGGGLYGDVDLSEPRTVRLTLYDSLPGRPVTAAPMTASPRKPVTYEARIGPLDPGTWEVWLGRYDAGKNLVEVPPQPVRIRVGAGASAVGSAERPRNPGELRQFSSLAA